MADPKERFWDRFKLRLRTSAKVQKRSDRLRSWLAWPIADSPVQRWVLVISLSGLLALLLYPSVLEPLPQYELGEVINRDIKASRTFLVEDDASTKQSRRHASAEVLSVYDLDDKLIDVLSQRIRQAFELARQPISEEDLIDLKSQFEAALGLELNASDWALLKQVGFSREMEAAATNLLAGVLSNGVAPSRKVLLDELNKGIVLRRLSNGQEKEIKDVLQLLEVDLAARLMKADARNIAFESDKFRPALQRLAGSVAIRLLRPNVTPNLHETDRRRKEAAKSVRPVYYQVRRGEMLAREGERITPQILARLKAETAARQDKLIWMRFGGTFLMLVVLLRCLHLPTLLGRAKGCFDGRDFLFIAATIVFVFLIVRLGQPVISQAAEDASLLGPQSLAALLPVAAAALLVGAILGLEAALLTGLAVSFLAAHLTEMRLEFFVLYFVSSLVAARSVKQFRTRSVLIKAGLWAGVANMILILSLRLARAEFLSLETPVEILAGLIGGLLSGVIVTGLLPLVESLFGYTTDVKLLEQANMDQPILKELLLQAPGSYHHSVIVGNMVEAAAESIGANSLLAKVAAYYHDVGKIKKPQYFVENQVPGENRHEKLAPSMSALILIAHVKDGMDLARRAKLGRQIKDIIAQHHGTSLITYFYDKAIKAKGDKAKVNIEDFRYPGPKPQTKEAGLVMLADQVEAACKSLTEPTPARIQGMVQKIINRAFSDGQLSDCELTLKDLHAIAKSFNKVLTGIFHQRIAYPQIGVKKPAAKRKSDGDSAAKRTKMRPDTSPEDEAEDSEGLKRLGIS